MGKLMLLFSIGAFFSLAAQAQNLKKLKKNIIDVLAQQPGVFAVAFKDLQTNKTLYLHEHEIFHAASTMKTPVLVETFIQAALGKFSLKDSVTINNQFKSIADSSIYSLDSADDSEFDLYKHIGEKSTIYDLLYEMITRSSNLATNIMIEKVGAANVTVMLRGLGLQNIQVLRGVEDNKAYEKGLNNVVSAYDLLVLFEKIATNALGGAEMSGAIIKILLDQQFNDIIPAKLPAGIKVAHKTGFIKGIHHDSGIVFLPDGRKYVLVLLSKDLSDDEGGIEAMAVVSRMIYDFVIRH